MDIDDTAEASAAGSGGAAPDSGSPQNPSHERGTDRRRFLKGSLALAATAGLARPLGASARVRGEAPAVRPAARTHVVVVGAGAFGGWTALWLLRRGMRVTLLDTWGPGNSRSSSGGESRVIRGIYGPDRIYVDWVVRSFELWRDSQARWREPLYHPTGALWMFQGEDAYARASLPLLEQAGLEVEELPLAAARRRFPAVNFNGVRTVFYEAEAGYLVARRACAAVVRAFTAEGGEFRRAAAVPGPIREGAMGRVELSDGTHLAADAYVFACGPWLAKLFPELLGGRIRPTRQEVFFFGLPAGETRYTEERFPVWVDFGERIFYGVPGNLRRGFKVADDTRGRPIDPDTEDRTVTPQHLERARELLGRRFPGLAGAPLLEARVCQYENSPDGHFILDRHPQADNLWIAGGGSGHGFKVGPAVGEHLASLVRGIANPLPVFSLARLPSAPETTARKQLSSGKAG